MNWTDLQQRAYVPYSNTPSACVIESNTGKVYAGVRIENASFPLTITEYQAGIFGCLSEGEIPSRLYIPPAHPNVPQVWINAYSLEVIRTEELKFAAFADIVLEEPVSFPSVLRELQSKCRIQESNFPVSCLLEIEPGKFISGVNIELSDWQLGLCAERIALAKAVAMGFNEALSIHITAAKGDFISPCGACRQVLVEHMPYKTMYLYHPDATLSEHTPAEFLPAFFNGKSITT
ncbi:MAG: hypothetical protein JJU41_06265 [Bacteroidetes bacterium]|nr:hypothetical protein [Bacteroidota bacterium]